MSLGVIKRYWNSMNLGLRELIIVLDAAGTLMVAFAALRVHHRVLYEHRIDNKVFAEMKLEQWVGLVGVIIIITSAVIKLVT